MYNKTVKLSNGITVPQLALGTWLIDAYKAGKIRAIGVSNFLKVDIDNLLEKAEVKSMVNQVWSLTARLAHAHLLCVNLANGSAPSRENSFQTQPFRALSLHEFLA